MHIKIKIHEILYIISMCVAFLGNNLIQVIAGGLAIVIGIFGKKRNLGLSRDDCKILFRWFFLPCLIIHMYTCILVFIGIADYQILSTNLLTYLPVLIAVCAVYAWGIRGCIDTFVALLIAWIVKIIFIICRSGLQPIVTGIRQIFIVKDFSGNVFEMDDIVLSSGYFLVLFLAMKITNKRNSIFLATMFLFIFALGVKRIGLVAVAATLFSYLVLVKMDKKKRFKACIVMGIFIFIFGIGIIYLLSDETFLDSFLNKYKINVMSRDYFWNYIMSQTDFSCTFFGLGRGSVKVLMLDKFSPFMHVHSDYIKMFVEIGFIPYLIWLWYYFVGITKRIKNRYGYDSAYIFFLTAVYTSVLYITDNTESYYICGLIRCIIPVAYIAYYKKNLTT